MRHYSHLIQAFALIAVTTSPQGLVGQQITSITDAVTPPGLAAGTPIGSYPLTNLDTVNPYSGSVNFRLPLVRVGGRGEAGYTITLPINPTRWRAESVAQNCLTGGQCQYISIADPNDWNPMEPGYGAGVVYVRYGVSGRINCSNDAVAYFETTTARVTFVSADGTETELLDVPSGGLPKMQTCSDVVGKERGTDFVSADGSFLRFRSSQQIIDDVGQLNTATNAVDRTAICPGGVCPANGTLTFRDGTQYDVFNGVVTRIKDRNGNVVTIHFDDPVELRPTKITDALGRETLIAYNAAACSQICDTITVKGAGGANRVVRIWKSSLSDALRSGSSISAYATLFPELPLTSGTYNPSRVISAVELPNGQQYQFRYNAYKELARVELPTGAVFEYDYGSGVSSNNTAPYFSSGIVGVPVGSNVYVGSAPVIHVYRRLLEKRTFLANQLTLRETFSRPESSASNSYQNLSYVDVIRHDSLNVPLERRRHFHYGAAGASLLTTSQSYFSGWREGREHTTEIRNATSAVQKEIRDFEIGDSIPGWASTNPLTDSTPLRNTRLKSSQVTRDGTLILTTTYTYDKYNNPTLITENGVNAGQRNTSATYLYTGNSAYEAFTKNLISLPATKKVYSSNPNAPASEVRYFYDEGYLTVNVGITGYDWPSDPNHRGNLTRIDQWRNLPSPAWLSTKWEYDHSGSVVKRIEPNLASTTYSYADNCSMGPGGSTFANVTKVTNALNHETQIRYDCWIGKPDRIQDANGRVTTAAYNDTLDRLTSISYPDQGSTTYQYNDFSRSVFESIALDSCSVSSAISRTTSYDQLGRVISTIQGDVTTTTDYDPLGRVFRAHIPRRPSEPISFSETTYDELSRPITVRSGCSSTVTACTPGGPVTTTSYSYSGTTTSVTDPAGVVKTTETDGFNRLRSVNEGYGAVSSSYLYDVLDNLTQVSQGIQTRTYQYDSLSRLRSAQNPESGLTQYQYDDNGNVTQRTDARGAAVNTFYDSLNRIITKSYNDGAPPVTHTWDPVGNKGLPASIQSTVSTTSFLGYDAMGRVTSSQQTIDGNSYLFEYVYNKAGLLETQTYPGGRQARTCYNNSGQEISQTGVSSTPNKTYATGATYASHGALASATIGPGAVSMVYNPSHRQLIQSRVNGYWQMDLSYCPNGVSPCATNNGNIRQIVLNDTMATRTQNFSYDSANRLQTAAEANGFAQTYGYDQYSNRWITPTSSLPGGNFQPTSAAWFDAATNRLQSAVGNTYFHDAAGNMIAEAATTFAYDAEGRMIRSTIPYATGTVITQYFYDGEGRRVKKQNQALGKTLYLYDAFGRLAVEFPEQAFAPCTTCYLYTDQVNTTRLVLDQGGTVMKRADHMPFGEEILNGAPWANGRGSLYADNNPVRQQFTGYLRNEPYEWALDFANARYYRRSNGRFTSPDQPLIDQHENDAQSWNLYSYVRNNPLRLIDPSGQVCVSPGGGNPDYDDPSLPSPTCKEVKDQDKALRPSVSVSPDWDELRLMMMRGVGESLSSPQAWSSIGRGAMENAYPIQSTIVECAASAIGGNCPSSDSEILYAAAVKPKFAQAAARVARLWAITKPAATKVIGGRTYMKDAKTGTWWSRDTAGHGGSAWKVYREKPGGALEWMADADAHGNFVSGKHKSSIGTLLR